MPETDVYYLFVAVLEYIVPMLVVCPSCVVSLFALRASATNVAARASTVRGRDRVVQGGSNNSSSATKTIIMLTVIYLVCNTPLLVYTVLSLIVDPDKEGVEERWPILYGITEAFQGPVVGNTFYFQLMNFSFTVSVPLNSTANTSLWTYRSKPMRRWVRGLFVKERAPAAAAWVVSAGGGSVLRGRKTGRETE